MHPPVSALSHPNAATFYYRVTWCWPQTVTLLLLLHKGNFDIMNHNVPILYAGFLMCDPPPKGLRTTGLDTQEKVEY